MGLDKVTCSLSKSCCTAQGKLPHCNPRPAHVMKPVDKDKKVRLVLNELPIFGEDSEAAAKAGLAAHKQGK